MYQSHFFYYLLGGRYSREGRDLVHYSQHFIAEPNVTTSMSLLSFLHRVAFALPCLLSYPFVSSCLALPCLAYCFRYGSNVSSQSLYIQVPRKQSYFRIECKRENSDADPPSADFFYIHFNICNAVLYSIVPYLPFRVQFSYPSSCLFSLISILPNLTLLFGYRPRVGLGK